MGLFSKKPARSEEQEAAEALGHCKKVLFEPQNLIEIEAYLAVSTKEILNLEPKNYYATTNMYLSCNLFYNDDYSELYMQVQMIKNEKVTGEGQYRKITFDLFKAILGKFGQRVQILKDN